MLNRLFNLKTRKYFLIVIIILTLLFLIGVYSASLIGTSPANLDSGKNVVRFEVTEPFYVMDLIKLNPTISVVSYTQENRTIGYVNLFNGIGENFKIENNLDYEVILSKNISLILPSGIGCIKKGA
jgi:hypothetical protein